MPKTYRFYLGNLFLFLSAVLIAYTYYPYALLYIKPAQAKSQIPQKGYFINIPKINAFAGVIEGVDTQNKDLYKLALGRGVANADWSANPGEGPIFMFAHSSMESWRMTRQNTAFLRLPELENGDEIELIKDGKFFKYSVYDKKEVWPNEINSIQNLGNELVLQTCTPVGTSLRRLLVFAR